jgi:hypothetical protein
MASPFALSPDRYYDRLPPSANLAQDDFAQGELGLVVQGLVADLSRLKVRRRYPHRRMELFLPQVWYQRRLGIGGNHEIDFDGSCVVLHGTGCSPTKLNAERKSCD